MVRIYLCLCMRPSASDDILRSDVQHDGYPYGTSMLGDS